jgi:hypothetical protein
MRAAAATWLAWTALTWALEGRVLTLLRPEATGARVAYVAIANLGVGLAVAACVIALLARRGAIDLRLSGFTSARRLVLGLVAGASLGLTALLAQRPPTRDPVVLLNVFAQVLPTSAAEVVVCWALLGGAVEQRLRTAMRRNAAPLAVAAASLAFGA